MRTPSPSREEQAGLQPVTIWRNVLSPQDCRATVQAMVQAGTVVGPVLRLSHDTVDVNMRNCSEHLLDPVQAGPVVAGMRRVAQQAAGEAKWSGRIALDGPKFCGYHAGGFFRVHQDRSEDPLDPGIVRARRLSIVCLLNDTTHHDGLPSYDGGTLVIHVPQPDGSRAPRNIRLEAGSVVAFRSDLLHEVRPVRAGVRYSAVGWLHDADVSGEDR